MLFTRELVQAESFERSAQLRRQDRDLGNRVVVEAAVATFQKRDGADHLPRNQQRRGHRGLRMRRRNPRITDCVQVVDEKRTPLLNRVHGNRCISRTTLQATKRLAVVGIGFSTDEFAVRGSAPEKNTAGLKEPAGQAAKGPEQLTGFGALEGGLGKFEE